MRITALLVFVFLFNFSATAQENEADNYRTLFYFNTTKNPDNSRLLEVEFLGRNKENKKDKIAVIAAPIKFFNVYEDEELLLGKANTNNIGIAQLILAPEQEYLVDESGYINLLARFEGTDALDEEEEELMIQDLTLELELLMEDSIPMAYINAYTFDSLGEQLPIEELEIIVGVESMISSMTLEEDYLEEGEYELELPMDIPGDAEGNFVVNVVVDEHDEFGTVIQKQSVNWGTRKDEVIEAKNELWTDGAPIWMYIVLTIMLVGVWANYAYTVRNLRKIKKMGNN